MTDNRIDVEISQEQVDKVLGLLKEIEAALPGLIELTPQQRKTMPRYSDDDVGFMQNTLSIAEQHPEILPPSFDLDEMRRDVGRVQKLTTLRRALTRVGGILDDSLFASGSESKGHGRSIYQFVKTHHSLTGKLEDTLAELAAHFAHNKPAKDDKPSA